MKHLALIFAFITVAVTVQAQVTNYTDSEWMTKFVESGLSIYDIEDVNVTIAPMPTRVDKESYLVYEPISDAFTLFVNVNQRKSYIERQLSHEIIHINQYYTGQLETNGETVVFNGIEYNLNEIPYSDRAWEIIAQRDEMKIKRKILL